MRKKISLKLFHLILIVLICLGIGYSAGNYKFTLDFKNYKPILGVVNQNPPAGSSLNMKVFFQVLNKINDVYYDKTKIDAVKMANGAISGMLQSLGDPYTSFFPPVANVAFKTQMAGEFSGIGAELSMNDKNQIIVIAPLDSSPAEKAGVKPGDAIVKVDGVVTSGWDVPKAVEHIRGHKGTKVLITVVHENEKVTHDFEIVRDTIQVKSVTSWIKKFGCDGKNCELHNDCSKNCSTIAYIRISQFGDKTNDEWMQNVNKLLPQIKSVQNFKGLILDVRSNPGGYLNDAVYIASEFIKSGPIVVQADGKGNKEPLNVNRTGLMLDIPMVVLIDRGSASASEIVSGALQDYKRALLIGENSFGKGTIQQAEDLEGGGSVHISIGKWLTPKERWVHGKGLQPDVEVKYDSSASSKLTEKLDNQIIKAVEQLSK